MPANIYTTFGRYSILTNSRSSHALIRYYVIVDTTLISKICNASL